MYARVRAIRVIESQPVEVTRPPQNVHDADMYQVTQLTLTRTAAVYV